MPRVAAVLVLSFLLAACGGTDEPTSPAADTPVATETSAPAPELAPLLIADDVLPGFQGSGAESGVQTDADEWAKTNREPDATQLSALGFVAGARKDLVGPPDTFGLNLVERFETDAGAGERLAYTVEALGNKKGQFKVSGVPESIGFESGSGKQLSRTVVFRKGDTVYLLSHQVSKRAPSVAALKQAVRAWYADLP